MFLEEFLQSRHNMVVAGLVLISQLKFLPDNVLNRRFSSFYRGRPGLPTTVKYWMKLF